MKLFGPLKEPAAPLFAFDWIQVNRDKTFQELPLNEIDLAFFAQASYFEFGRILTPGEPFKRLFPLLTTENIYKIAEHNLEPANFRKAIRAFFRSKRYSKVKIGYVQEINSEQDAIQDGFMTFLNEKNQAVITFRGTNLKIYGWEEDALLCYGTMPGHQLGLDYLQKTIALLDPKTEIILSGHSKGGNIAGYAAINAEKRFQDRIEAVYMFDSPGFKKSYIGVPSFEAIKPRYHKLMPQDSMIGILLNGTDKYEVVQAEGKNGMKQHSFYTWHVEANGFKRAGQLSRTSLAFQKAFSEWLSILGEENLREYMDYLFLFLKEAGIKELTDLSGNFLTTAKTLILSYGRSKSPEKKKFASASSQLARLFIHYSFARSLSSSQPGENSSLPSLPLKDN